MTATVLSPQRAVRLRQRAWLLTTATIAWNAIEAAVAIGSGVAAGSIALVGFGLDSVVEVSSALVVAWFLTRHGSAGTETAERRAVRLIAVTFFAIAAYVTFDALSILAGVGEEPEHSPVGLAVLLVSLVVMPSLLWAKRAVARELGSATLRADSENTKLCVYLSAVVLLGLAANSFAGWWWMDPVAGLAIAGLALKEGRDAWREGELCTC